MKKRSKVSAALLILLAALIVARILAPGWITRYVNTTLDNVPGYAGSIDDVDLYLWRGSYTIHGIDLRKVETDTEIPFVAADYVDLSVDWGSLIEGAVVGEIEFTNPSVNFVTGKAEQSDQFGESVDWTRPVRELLPIDINRLAISNGTVRFVDEFSTPPVDISIESLEMEVLNLNNVVKKDTPLPSPIKLRATSIGGGALAVDGKINALRQVPDFDIEAKFEGVSLPALNDFLRAYARIDAEKGVFNLYVEMAADDGELNGYVKPIITDMQILSLENDSDQPLQLVWEAVVGLVSEVFENQPKDQFASKVPISGSLGNTEIGVLPTLLTVLRNAFVQALQKRTDDDISFTGVGGGNAGQEQEEEGSANQQPAPADEKTGQEKSEVLVDKALGKKK